MTHSREQKSAIPRDAGRRSDAGRRGDARLTDNALAQVRAERWLAQGGLRPTRQRLALARLLVGDGGNRHVTAESLFEAARRTCCSVSLATVYNTLRSFTEAGLMSEITVDGTRSYFDTDVSDHAHFYWEDEGRLTDAPHGSVAFQALPEAPDGAEISKVEVVIRLRRP